MNTGKTACLALGALMALAGTAMGSLVLIPNEFLDGGNVGAVRYKGFGGTSGANTGTYLGVDGLGTANAAIRVAQVGTSGNPFTWNRGVHNFTFQYDATNNLLTSFVDGLSTAQTTLVYSSATTSNGGTFLANASTFASSQYNAGAWNALQMSYKTGGTGIISFSNMVLADQNGNNPQSFTAPASYAGSTTQNNLLTGYDFSTGFTLTGTFDLSTSGTFGTNEGAVLNIGFGFDQLGVQTIPLPPAAWAGLGSLAGVAGFGMIRRRRNAAL